MKGIAHALAAAPYQAPTEKLPPAVERLDWDHWQAIRFRDDRSLWVGDGLRFQVRFFHLGFRIRKPVRLFSVDGGFAQEILYDPAMFDYGSSGLKGNDVPSNLGFAGFRLLFHTDWIRDFAAFQGASYFRAVDIDRQYGMSQRGLAIDCGASTPEEFPDFIAYYLEKPAKDSSVLTIYGLLDSPSVAGAYRFVIDASDPLTMDIDAALYPRKQIERVGSPMHQHVLWSRKNDRRVDKTGVPEIHDSDGLQIWSGSGEWIWRPLMNPTGLRVNSYTDERPRGFGLMQRERRFEQYQDDGVFYDKRLDCWVEPQEQLGQGRGDVGRDSDRGRDWITLSRSGHRPIAAEGAGAALCLPPERRRDNPVSRGSGARACHTYRDRRHHRSQAHLLLLALRGRLRRR